VLLSITSPPNRFWTLVLIDFSGRSQYNNTVCCPERQRIAFGSLQAIPKAFSFHALLFSSFSVFLVTLVNFTFAESSLLLTIIAIAANTFSASGCVLTAMLVPPSLLYYSAPM
jgi:hypothetical protein